MKRCSSPRKHVARARSPCWPGDPEQAPEPWWSRRRGAPRRPGGPATHGSYCTSTRLLGPPQPGPAATRTIAVRHQSTRSVGSFEGLCMEKVYRCAGVFLDAEVTNTLVYLAPVQVLLQQSAIGGHKGQVYMGCFFSNWI